MKHNMWMNTAARIGVVAMTAGLGQAAAAQDAAKAPHSKADAVMLEEVIVTARKISESLQDAAIAVTSVSGDTLQVRGIRTLNEISKLSSSVKVDTDSDVRAGVSIRGVGQSSDTNAAPGVGLFVDGIYQPGSAYYTVPFFDIERIEVLKGPQGTLYGKNTMGGAINIISRAPAAELGGAVMVEVTGAEEVGNLVFNLPILGDLLANRTALFYRDSEGLQKSKTTGKHANEREDFAVRSRFDLNPDNGFTSSLSLFYADLESAPFAYSETEKGLNDPIDNVTKDENGLIVSKYKSANFTNSFDFGSITLTSLTSYDKADVDTLVDGDYSGAAGLLAGGVSDRDTFAQELRLADSGAEDANFSWLIGAYYSDDKLRSTSFSEANFGPFFGFQPLGNSAKKETGETNAVFGQVTWVVDKFEFVAGLRYDHEKRINNTHSVDGNPFTGYVTTDLKRQVTSEEWQPKVSVSYHVNDDVMAYGVVSRGFRAGGFNALTAPPEFAAYNPETTTSFEAGLKSELMERRLRLNGAVFYTDYTDILQNDIFFNNGAQTVVSRNGGKATSYGLELDAAYKVSQELTLAGGYTYLDIKNDETPLGLVRREVSGFSNHNFNLQADYLRPVGDEMTLGAHIGATYIGETWMASEPEKRDGHALVDASLDLTFQNYTVSLFGKNIFDEEYYLSYIPASSTIGGKALGLLNRSAEFGVRFAASF